MLKLSETKNVVHSVIRACRLLESFSHERPILTLGELSSRANLTKGTAHRLLSTLEVSGLVGRTPEGGYRLMPKLFRLGSIGIADLALRSIARPIMLELAGRIGETSYLMVPSDVGALCVERVDGSKPIRVMVMDIGTTLPYHTGAGPVVLLANRTELEGLLEEPLAPLTEKTHTDKTEILASLPKIRAQGFAESVDDVTIDVAAIGVPIRDGTNTVIAALSVAGLKSHILQDRDTIVEALKQASATISHGLGATA